MTRSNEGLMNDGKQRGSSSVVFKYTWDRDKTYVAINMRLTISGQDRSIKIRYAIVGRNTILLVCSQDDTSAGTCGVATSTAGKISRFLASMKLA